MAYDLGIVIPVYRSRESVKKLVLELEKTFLPDIKIRTVSYTHLDVYKRQDYTHWVGLFIYSC